MRACLRLIRANMHLTPDLLGPGDAKSAALDPAQFEWTRIRSVDDPLFPVAYGALWAEFGAANEMETRAVLAGRFALGPAMRYEMVLARKDGAVAAVRDHTAILVDGEVVVHLSHNLVMPEWRRSGLAGWMRAVPLIAAREVAAANGRADARITLVAEMEYDDGGDPKRAVRLAAYGRAGFLAIDPGMLDYHQPDFREPAVIDATGGPAPLRFQLLIRQVGHESETTVSGARVRRFVSALHALYGALFRHGDMAHPLLSPDRLPGDDACVPLLGLATGIS